MLKKIKITNPKANLNMQKKNIQLSEEEVLSGYKFWLRYYPFENRIKNNDDIYLNEQFKSYYQNPTSWLRATRQALFLKATTVARKAEVTKAAYSKIELAESSGNISIETLAKYAEAMDCELIYFIRPKNRKKISEIVWAQILPEVIKHPWLKVCDPKKRGNALGALAREKMLNSEFRKKLGWSNFLNIKVENK